MQKQFVVTISALLAIITLAGAQTPAKGAARGTTLETVGVSRESGSHINIEITTKGETASWVETLDHPARIVVDLPNTVLGTGVGPIPVQTNGVRGVRVGTDGAKTTRVVVDLAKLCRYELVPGSGHRLILKLDLTSPAPALAAEAAASSTPGTPVRGGSLPSSQSEVVVTQTSSTAPSSERNIAQPAPATGPSAGSAASTVAAAGAPGSNANPASQASSGGLAAAPAAEASSTTASAQLNIAQPAPSSTPAVPVSNASEASAGAAANAAAGGRDPDPVRIGVGGHIGVVLPLVTRAGGTTTSISDSFSIGMPVGVTIHGQGRMAFDMEFVPVVQNSPRQVNLTFHPGLIFSVGHRFSVGMRAAFDANSTQFGFTPLVNKSWPIEGSFFKAYFVEADLPVRFNRPAGLPASNPVTFAMHFGLGF